MKPLDLEAVGKIESENLTSWSQSSLRQELAVRQGSCFVAEAGGHRIVGWCACRKIWPEAELLKIAVVEREKTKGVGSFLLQHLMEELQGQKFSVLFLEVRSQNMAALKFYNHHGFAQIGMRRAYYCDPKDDALILRKNIC